jgi:hypothetical protein
MQIFYSNIYKTNLGAARIRMAAIFDLIISLT